MTDVTARRGNRRSAWRWALLAAVVVGQFVALYAPGQHGPSIDLPLDKVVHLLLFGTVAAVAVWAGAPWRWVVGCLVLQAGVSEVVQEVLLPGRGAQWGDLIADLVGTALGVLLGRRFVGDPIAGVSSDSGRPRRNGLPVLRSLIPVTRRPAHAPCDCYGGGGDTNAPAGDGCVGALDRRSCGTHTAGGYSPEPADD